MAKVNLILDNPNSNYFPGSVISGKVIVLITKPKKLSQISVRFIGKSFVLFNQHPEKFQSEDRFLQKEKILWTSNSIEPEIVKEQFKFSFTLPTNCASTFSSKYGGISYEIIAQIYTNSFKDVFKKWGYKLANDSYISTKFLTILQPSINSALSSSHQTIQQIVKESNGLKVKASIPKSAFACGQIIKIYFEILNFYNRMDNKIKIKCTVKSITSYRGKGQRHKYHMTKSIVSEYICQKHSLVVNQNMMNAFTQILQLPNELIPSFVGNTLIKIEYIINIKVEYKNMENIYPEIMELSFPIVVLKNDGPNNCSSGIGNNINDARVLSNSSSATSNIDNMAISPPPPPSYSQATSSQLDAPPPYVKQ